MKNEFNAMQFLSIPVLSMATVTVGVYLNAQLAFMMEDKNMFNVPPDEIGQLTSNLTVYSLPFSMLMTFITSYIYELLGRRLTIFVSFLSTALVYIAIPYTAPDVNKLLVLRILIGITMAAPIAHPLIPDYIKRSSRGKAVALSGVGLVLGEVFSIGVLFNMTKTMDYFGAFKVAAAVIALFSFYFLFAIKDPDLNKLRSK